MLPPPPIPVPPIAPSFAARISTPSPVQRPKTAPSARTVHIPARMKSFTEASAAFSTPSPLSATPLILPAQPDHAVPPPPLPLILQVARPPLRKKKSFSRVSNWLFPASVTGDHSRTISLDSITNTPKPVTTREGFYQCVELGQSTAMSTASLSSTVETLESELDEPQSCWNSTPNSSPGPVDATPVFERRRNSVGVAF